MCHKTETSFDKSKLNFKHTDQQNEMLWSNCSLVLALTIGLWNVKEKIDPRQSNLNFPQLLSKMTGNKITD